MILLSLEENISQFTIFASAWIPTNCDRIPTCLSKCISIHVPLFIWSSSVSRRMHAQQQDVSLLPPGADRPPKRAHVNGASRVLSHELRSRMLWCTSVWLCELQAGLVLQSEERMRPQVRAWIPSSMPSLYYSVFF